MYDNILFGYDGSPSSKKAFERAIETAVSNKARLVIVEVVPLQSTNEERISLGFGVIDASFDSKKILDEKEKDLKVLKNTAKDFGVENVETEVLVGKPKICLSKEVPEKYDIDLTVIGATGAGRVSQLVMGSNAIYIVENSISDVVVVK